MQLINTALASDVDAGDNTSLPSGAQAGFIMIWAALLMMVLVMMAAFVIDLGAWYTRTSKIQQAADAASAASAQQLYNSSVSASYDAAVAVLESNGFPASNAIINGAGPGTATLNITICPNQFGVPCANANQSQVVVTDNEPPQFFSGVVLSKAPSLSRQSISEFTQLPQASSPSNVFGDGTPNTGLGESIRKTGLWARIAGPCLPAEQGDLIASQMDQNGVAGQATCNTSAAGVLTNPKNAALGAGGYTLGTLGYFYKINLTASATTRIDVKDATYWPGLLPLAGRTMKGFDAVTYSAPTSTNSPTGWRLNQDNPWNWRFVDVDGGYASTVALTGTAIGTQDRQVPDLERGGDFGSTLPYGKSTMVTTFTLYDQNKVIVGSPIAIQGKDPAYTLDKGWKTFFTVATAGEYYLQVTSSDSTGLSFASNSFAVAAHVTGTAPCIAPTAGCPSVAPEGYFSVVASIPRTAAASSQDVPLALVKRFHSGKTFRLTLFDPGEGVDSLQILDTHGTPLMLTANKVKIADNGAETLGSAITLASPYTTLDVSNAVPPCTSSSLCPAADTTWWETARDISKTSSKDRYNDRMLQIQVTIPAIATVSDEGYFSIRYNVAGGSPLNPPNDATTWKIEILDNSVAIVR